eukprot:1113338_1
MDDIRVTLETYKSAEKTRNRVQTITHLIVTKHNQTITHHTQTDDIPIDFETRSKIISLQNTIKPSHTTHKRMTFRLILKPEAKSYRYKTQSNHCAKANTWKHRT